MKPEYNGEIAPISDASLEYAEAMADDLCARASDAQIRTLMLPLDLDDSWRVSCDE